MNLSKGCKSKYSLRDKTRVFKKMGTPWTPNVSMKDFLEIPKPLGYDFSMNANRIKKIMLIGDSDLNDHIGKMLSSFCVQKNIQLQKDMTDLYDLLVGDDPGWVYDAIKKIQYLTTFETWSDCFVVYAAKKLNPLLLQYISIITYSLNIPWVFSALDGSTILIGPTIVSDYPCFYCFRQCLLSRTQNVTPFSSNKKTHDPVMPNFSVIKNILSSHVSSEVIHYMLTGINYTCKKSLSIYLPTMEMNFNSLLRLSGCYSCEQPSSIFGLDCQHSKRYPPS